MMNVAIVQNKVYERKEDTFEHIVSLLDDLDDDVDMIVFPEMFSTPYQADCFRPYSETSHGESHRFLKEIAMKHTAVVVGGSVPERADERIYNTSWVFDSEGKRIAHYRKQHLFAVEYPDGTVFDEGDVLTAGQEDVTFDTDFGRMGLMICFDVRFPSFAERLTDSGATFLLVPAAFNTYTGPMHWHVTMRARAIDNQVFLMAAGPSRNSYGSYDPYGHSLIVDPLGNIISEANEQPEVIQAAIDTQLIDQARQSIPIYNLRNLK